MSEEQRLEEEKNREKNWKRWGPYLSERQWATVREDYSPKGTSWEDFPHAQARMRAYRWGEDGLLGICDRECRLCFGWALWNGEDPFLKERLFGVIPTEGNHGEDVKECYYYLDSTPTHSYMKALYKYPQRRFPYEQLVEENQKRGLFDPEYELLDTGIFHENRYFDVSVEYAKNTPDDLFIKITLTNQSTDSAPLALLPTLWFRNTWTWGYPYEGGNERSTIRTVYPGLVKADHPTLGRFCFAFDLKENPQVLFTENETNTKKLFNTPNTSPYVKDAFHEYVVEGKKESVNPRPIGSKCAPYYALNFKGLETKIFHFRLCSNEEMPEHMLNDSFEKIFIRCKEEAESFYISKIPLDLSKEATAVARSAYANLLWSKQFYHFVVDDWLKGDPKTLKPPTDRLKGRNTEWRHLFCSDVLSVPDKWEYPWFASWDLAFHMIPYATIDPEFAKQQILLLLREWYMHPNGQIPAYEYEFSDVNPPVHAWAAWRVYKMSAKKGKRDQLFLEKAFQKLLLNFTWWVNRKDREGHNLFSGGFLGLDNIGVFDRSKIQVNGWHLEQADATAWMAFYCLTMLSIALELATFNPVYEDMASKFFEHFVSIAEAINTFRGWGLWNEEDGFYYDSLKTNGDSTPVRVRSLVGLIPLIAVEILEREQVNNLPGFFKRMQWFLKNKKELGKVITYCKIDEISGNRILAIPTKERLQRICRYLFDEKEFLSTYGLRSLSKFHEKNPYSLKIGPTMHSVQYEPGMSNSYLFGGNSNWRGPIWLPTNYLIIEALERYGHFYGEDLKVEFPTGSGTWLTLKQAADRLSRRLCRLFLPDPSGRRPCLGGHALYTTDPHWKELHLFHEYFDAETGEGLGASHQTGWTALIAKILSNF